MKIILGIFNDTLKVSEKLSQWTYGLKLKKKSTNLLKYQLSTKLH